MGEVPLAPEGDPTLLDPVAPASAKRTIPLDPAMQARLEEARRAADAHAAHDEHRPPNPERLRR
jgi:hypothetical protein